MMTLKLKNVRIDNCGTGISMSIGTQLDADGLVITNTRRAIEVREPQSLLQSLGLPATTPPEFLIEALRILEGASGLPPNARIQKLSESRLSKWLGVTADLAGLGSVLLSAQAQGLVSEVADRIFR